MSEQGGSPGGDKGMVEELQEKWDAEDAAADAVAERVTTPAESDEAPDIDDDEDEMEGTGFVEIPDEPEPESHTEFILMDTRTGETLEISGFAYQTIRTINSVVPPRMAF